MKVMPSAAEFFIEAFAMLWYGEHICPLIPGRTFPILLSFIIEQMA
jgi:hypothetical protein